MAKVHTTTETITPKTAANWLEHNTDNRPVRDHHVKGLAEEMKAGRWLLNGEAIIFDHNGDLLDGQHRLWAAVEHNQTFESVVVRGVDPLSFQTLDSGMKRSAGDVLKKVGIPYSNIAAAAIRLIHFYETGRKDHFAVSRMSNSQTFALLDTYPRIKEAIGITGPRDVFKRSFSVTALTALVYFALEVDPAKVTEFLDALQTGASLKRGDPRLTCRNYFLNSATKGVRLHQRTALALYIKAWNAWIEERDMQALKFVDAEDFPEFSHRVKKARPAPRRIKS